MGAENKGKHLTTVMRIDIYYRFIGKVGSENEETLKAAKSRRASIPLAPGA